MADYERIKSRIRGPIAYPTTPYCRSGKGWEVDEAAFARQIRFLIDRGVPVITPCGGTGEFFSLRLDEWRALVRAAVREAKGTQAVIMPSVGGGIAQAVEMAGEAQDLGCEIVQLTFLDPMFGFTEEGAYEYNRAIASSASIAVMPFKSAKVPMSVGLATRLCSLKNAVAFKEESGDVAWLGEFLLENRGRVAVVCGGGEGLAPYYLLAGAQAFTTGIANLAPHLSLELYQAAVEQDWARALAVHERLRPLSRLRSKPGRIIPVIKEGLRILGLASEVYARPPVMPLDEDERRELEGILADLGLC